MKLKLGPKTFSVHRVKRITRAGNSIAHIHFVTRESISVTCGISEPDGVTYTYPGTYEELKAFIEKHKRA